MTCKAQPPALLTIFSLAILATFARPAVAQSAEPLRPNIIFLMADDMGPNDLGCYGQKRIQTPHIDRLAAEGMRFTQCYAGATVCAPARCVLMTGLHTGHARVRDNYNAAVGGIGPQKRLPLAADDVTVATVLKGAGYVTGMTGKWGLGEPESTGLPRRHGFDEWFGYLNQREAHNYYPESLWKDEELYPLPGNQGGKREQYSHDLFTEFALDFIRRHRDETFFLYVPWCVPHVRFEIPSLDSYADEPWEDSAKVYAAMITRMDRDVGRIIGLLKELDLDERTLVFFCSDNGGPYRWEGVFDSNHPFRGVKEDLYEGGIRTPMVARWPGRIPAGKVDETIWSFVDFLPTAAELAGARPPENLDGVSIVPTLLGENQDLDSRMLYWEAFADNDFQQAVRYGRWKALRLGVGRPLQLFDVIADPGETVDHAAREPRVVAEIEEYLKTARTDSPAWPVPMAAGK